MKRSWIHGPLCREVLQRGRRSSPISCGGFAVSAAHALFAVTAALGLAGCAGDFDPASRTYPCSTDSDCVPGWVCAAVGPERRCVPAALGEAGQDVAISETTGAQETKPEDANPVTPEDANPEDANAEETTVEDTLPDGTIADSGELDAVSLDDAEPVPDTVADSEELDAVGPDDAAEGEDLPDAVAPDEGEPDTGVDDDVAQPEDVGPELPSDIESDASDVLSGPCDGAVNGAPCDADDDPCTDDACVAGECVVGSAALGAPCDDGDPCTATDLCDGSAVCVGLADGCQDQTATIYPASDPASVLSFPSGRFIIRFPNFEGVGVRLGDRDGTLHAVEKFWGSSPLQGGSNVVRGTSGEAVMLVANHVGDQVTCGADAACSLGEHRVLRVEETGYAGAPMPGAAIEALALAPGQQFEGVVSAMKAHPLAFTDGTLGIVHTWDGPVWQTVPGSAATPPQLTPQRREIHLTRLSSALASLGEVTLAAGTPPTGTGLYLSRADAEKDVITMPFDACVIPDGLNRFAVAWGIGNVVHFGRFSKTGELLAGVSQTVTSGWMHDLRLACAPTAAVLLAWDAVGEDGSGLGVRAAVVPKGSAAVVKFLANETTEGSQWLADAERLADGSWLVSWIHSPLADASKDEGRARRFAADGSPMTGELDLDTTLPHRSADLAAFDDGGWMSVSMAGFPGVLHARQFGPDDQPRPGLLEHVANTTVGGDQTSPVASVGPAGHVLVAWVSAVAAAPAGEVVVRAFLPDGTPVSGERPVDETTSGSHAQPALAGTATVAVVAWQTVAGDVMARRIDALGSPIGDPIAVAASDEPEDQPAVAAAADGSWVAGWRAGGATPALRYRVTAAEGEPLPEQALTTALGAADLALAAAASATAVSKAWFAVWSAPDVDQSGIWLSRIPSDGGLPTSPVQLNEETNGPQGHSAIAVNADGTIVVVCWDGTNNAIVCRALDPVTLVISTRTAPWGGPLTGFPALAFTEANRAAVVLEAGLIDGFDDRAVIYTALTVSTASMAPVGFLRVANRTWPGEQAHPFALSPSPGLLWVGWQSPLVDGDGDAIVYRVVPAP